MKKIKYLNINELQKQQKAKQKSLNIAFVLLLLMLIILSVALIYTTVLAVDATQQEQIAKEHNNQLMRELKTSGKLLNDKSLIIENLKKEMLELNEKLEQKSQ